MTELDGLPVVNNPGPQMVSRELRNKFTGFTYHQERTQPWAAWFKGHIIFFSADQEEVRLMLQRNLPKFRPSVYGQNRQET